MSRRPTHFQLLSHHFAHPQDLLVILLAGSDQGTGESFLPVLGSEEDLESQSWIKFGETRNLNDICSSADIHGFHVKIQSKFGDLESFSQVLCIL
jgi:hypothetical protein